MAMTITARSRHDLPNLDVAQDALSRLQRLLGRNKWLHEKLCHKIGRLQQSGYFDLNLNFSPPQLQEDATMSGAEFEQLQLDAFDFNSILGLGDSPGTDSLTSAWSGSLPQSSFPQDAQQQPPEVAWPSSEIPTPGTSFAKLQDSFQAW